MKFYKVETIESKERYLVSNAIELKKGDIVVIANDNGEIVTAQVNDEVDEYTALIKGNEVEKILHVMDLKNWHERRNAKVKKSQLERIMKDKIELIKNMELLEKYAGKDSTFATLLAEFKQASSIE